MSDIPAPDCIYCDQAGADCCVRLTAPSSGPSLPVHAHEACAADHGLKPLYKLTPPSGARLEQAS